MFNFKKSLIFSIALIVAGLVFFIFSTNSIEAKMEKEPVIEAQPGGVNVWTQPAGNYDDRVDDPEDGVEPEPKPEPEINWGTTVVKPADVKPPPADWAE